MKSYVLVQYNYSQTLVVVGNELEQGNLLTFSIKKMSWTYVRTSLQFKQNQKIDEIIVQMMIIMHNKRVK